jgi:hypothetical protein
MSLSPGKRSALAPEALPDEAPVACAQCERLFVATPGHVAGPKRWAKVRKGPR